MFESRETSYITLKDDIRVSAFCSNDGDGNILTIDGFLTIYGDDDQLQKIADVIQGYLDRKEVKEAS